MYLTPTHVMSDTTNCEHVLSGMDGLALCSISFCSLPLICFQTVTLFLTAIITLGLWHLMTCHPCISG